MEGQYHQLSKSGKTLLKWISEFDELKSCDSFRGWKPDDLWALERIRTFVHEIAAANKSRKAKAIANFRTLTARMIHQTRVTLDENFHRVPAESYEFEYKGERVIIPRGETKQIAPLLWNHAVDLGRRIVASDHRLRFCSVCKRLTWDDATKSGNRVICHRNECKKARDVANVMKTPSYKSRARKSKPVAPKGVNKNVHRGNKNNGGIAKA